MTFIEHNAASGKPRAIETVYRGFRFRSRLEARWAVFFETLGLAWEYEPEGFDLGGVWYLPDFRVKTPQGENIWYEIKPKGVETDEKFERFKRMMADDAADRTGFCGSDRVEILAGDPVDLLFGDAAMCPRCGFINADGRGYQEVGTIYSRKLHHMLLAQCYPCDAETPFGGDSDEEPGLFGVTVLPHKGWVTLPASIWRFVQEQKLMPAALKARQARFEHGERP